MKQALRLNPDDALAWSQCAILWMSQKRWEESIVCLHNALALAPGALSHHVNWAQALQATGGVNDALKVYEFVFLMDPLNARAHYNFSLLMSSLELKAELVQALEKAVMCEPSFASAWFNLGFVAKAQGRLLNAQAYLERSLLIRPFHASSHNNLGVIHKGQARLSQAIQSYDRSIVIDPSDVQGLINKANALQDLKQIDLALSLYESVLLIEPQHVDVHLSQSFAYLQSARFQEGWESYEWRWLDSKLSSPILKSSKPRLQKGMVTHRLLIWPEQGVGTEVMFAKFLHHVNSLADHVIVKLDPRLIGLMARTHPDLKFVPNEEQVSENEYDMHLPLASLGGWFGRDFESIAATANHHLVVDESRKLDFLRRFKTKDAIWIGLNWKSKSSTTGKDRSIELKMLMQALNLPNVQFIDLQYGDTSQEMATLSDDWRENFLQIADLDLMNDLDGLAALITCCDWVVSVDNSTAHLASATGTPTLILLPLNADWRWFQPGVKTPWYANTRLFWQDKIGVWDAALDGLVQYLKSKMH
jgi:tetratricopeptide (TPR) repeat protein